MPSLFPPFVLFIVAAVAIPFLKGRGRDLFILAVPVLAFAQLMGLPLGTHLTVNFLDRYDLVLLEVTQLRLCFAYVFVIIAFTTSLYAIHVKQAGQHVAAFVYIGASLGVVFAGDYFTLFVFWELMAVGSTAVILCRRTRAAREASYRYVLVHVAGGACLMAGILLQLDTTGSVALVTPEWGGWAFYLVMAGVCLNAAVPPFSAWLSDAYPEASVTGAVYLTTYTTKTAVFVLALLFAGSDVLMWGGAIMTIYGVVFATMENDIRRLLAFHIISQVGYMVCGVGLGTELAVNGASAHAFSHILYKALLFMGTGAVLEATGRRQMSELGGILRRMWPVFICYMVAGFSISGVPGWNGFISKSMIISAAGELHRSDISAILTLAAVGTFFSTTLKLPYYTFLGKENPDIEVKPLPKNMIAAMVIVAGLCTLFGIFPGLLYQLLPFGTDYHPWTADHVVDALQLLTACGIAFWIMAKVLGGHRTMTTDTDWLYRTAGNGILRFSQVWLVKGGLFAEHVARELIDAVTALVRSPATFATRHSIGAAMQDGKTRDTIGIGVAISIFLALAYAVIVLAF